jgi:hypothetical protein
MNGDLPLENKAHMAGHAMREVESALREVMLPDDFQPGRCGQCHRTLEAHRRQISTIVETYKIEEPVRSFWSDIANADHEFSLFRWAHRNALEPPRVVDQRLQELWSRFQVMVDTLLEKIETSAFRTQSIIDKLVAIQQPCANDVKTLRNRVPNNLVCRFSFFNKLQNPAWLPLLRQKGFFSHPPAPVLSEDGAGVGYPVWPQSVYLIRMAELGGDTAEQVKEIMSGIDTMNLAVHYDLIDAALAMPASLAAGWADKETQWLNEQSRLPEHLPIEHRLGELISHLAKGGELAASLGLANSLLSVTAEDKGVFKVVRAKISQWQYAEAIKKNIPDLLTAAEAETFDLLCRLLQSAVAARTRSDAPPREDFSYVWRRTIADDKDERLEHIEDILVRAVRDAVMTIVRNDQSKLPVVIDQLENMEWRIFDRIALHLLGSFPDVAPLLVAARLSDYDRFCARTLRVEYDSLSMKCFGCLSKGEQDNILGWIEEGPPHAGKTCAGVRSDVERVRTEGEIERMSNEWRLHRLAPIREHLPKEWSTRLERWVAEFGEPTPSSEKERVGIISGDRSPVSLAELAAKQVQEVVQYLITWKPSGQFDGPSADGLAETVKSLVAVEPDRFAASAHEFEATNPVYVEAALHGLRNAAENGKKFRWTQVLELCRWVVQQPRDAAIREGRYPGDSPGWKWARSAVLFLVERGLRETDGEIPFESRSAVWEVLTALCEDPDPDPHPDPREETNDNDAHPTIDSIRGQALEQVLNYGAWIQRCLGKARNSGESATGFGQMPEVRKVLDIHLNPNVDRSLEIRTLYGLNIGQLFELDADWTRKNIARIFPSDSDSMDLRHAAWNGWIVFCSPASGALGLLSDEYKYAVARVEKKGGTKPSRTHAEYELAAHLMMFYYWGQVGLEPGGLLGEFYAKADDELCARAAQKVGQDLWRDKGPVAEDLLLRLKLLWAHRMDDARRSQSPHIEELSQFGWWFASGKFEDSWVIEQLIAILHISGKIESQHLVAERLVTLCPKLPFQVLECFNALLIHDREGWTAGRCRNEISSVLKQTAGGADPCVIKARSDLLNRMVARGLQVEN